MIVWPRRRLALGLLAAAALAAAALAVPSVGAASARRAAVTIKTVQVGAPGNPSVGIVPFTDAIYQSCADAPDSQPACQTVGGVD
jgi:hypothetical protein